MFVRLPKAVCFADFILLLAVVFFGGFNEYISCFLSAAISVYLIFKIFRSKRLVINITFISVSLAAVCLFYGITSFWAIDSGMAIIGFFKFLPIFLYAVLLWQSEGIKAIEFLPRLAAAIIVVSVIGMQFDFCKSFFSVSGRLGGSFQYPNTFALLLLICQLLVLQKEKIKISDYIIIAVLIGGMLYTGSRTALIVFALSNLSFFLFCGSKRAKITVAALAVSAFAVVGVTFLIWGDKSIFSRLLSISFAESTFIGRILYFVDALPLLLKYPFGMGYMGYFYLQGSIQTGVYSVIYAHNDFLQLMLDIGIIPALMLAAAIVAWFFKRNVSKSTKITVAAIIIHSLFDFNLQFNAMFMILVLLTNTQGKQIVLTKKTVYPVLFCSVAAAACAYMGVALLLANIGQLQLSKKLYPYNTQNNLAILDSTEDIEYANAIADDILEQNTAYYAPYSIKAKYSYSKGEFASMFSYKEMAIERYPLRYSEYTDYCKMLINGIAIYERMGNVESADICRRELISTRDRLADNKNRISSLGKKIDNQPWTRLPQEIINYIEDMEE